MHPLRLLIDKGALLANWAWFRNRAGVPAAAAVKADGYGLGAAQVVAALHAEGCRAFAVSTFAEASALGFPGEESVTLVLHGFMEGDAAAAAALPWARPVLNTAAQVRAFASTFPGRPADLMVDTGMNRLGLAPGEVATAMAAVPVQTLHSHLAAADEPGHPLTALQLQRFQALAAGTPGVSHALANSAGIACGPAFAFDLVRPGLGLYGGQPHPDAMVKPVVQPQARIVQLRAIEAGESVGYGATWTATRLARIATLNLGYADGLPRALGPHLRFRAGTVPCPVVGRISMDLIAADVSDADVSEGDFLSLDFDLPRLSAASGLSQYELLVSLSRRYERVWH